MRMHHATHLLLACVLLASCNENQPPSTDPRSPTGQQVSELSAAPAQPVRAGQVDPRLISAVGPAAPVRAAGTEKAAPVAPSNAQWTLYCQTIRGPVHVDEGNRIKSQLMINPQLHDWYLVHEEDDTILCYGYYANNTDARARSDKKRIESLIGVSGQPLFTGVVFQPISAPDPEAPPEWNLANTPRKMYWSLQIAAYRGSPERKKYAVDGVREARRMGVEAYYFHGPTISSVCVGAWPIEAVKRQGERNVARAADPETSILVMNDVVPEYMKPVKYDKNGKPVLIVAPKLEVIDKSLTATIAKYPEHAVNGEVRVITAQDGQQIPTPSFLVQIPHPEDGQDPFAGAPDPVGPDDPDAVRVRHDGVSSDDSPGAGKLRTLGEH